MFDLFEAVIGSDQDEPAILRKHLGFEGMLPVTWAAAGGVLFGGYAVAVLTLMERLSGAGLFVTAGALFVMGAAFGFVHGAVLAYLGRAPGMSHNEVLGALARAVLYSIPVLALTWAIAGWIALTVIAIYIERPLAYFGVAIGWILGLGVLVVALAFGSRGFRQALARWPDRVPGTVLVALGFAALVVTFFFDRPELWWTGREVGMPGPMILAGGVAFWLIGPLATLSFWMLRTLPNHPRELIGRTVTRGATGMAVGLVAGGGLGLLVHLTYGDYGVLPLALWTGSAVEAIAVGLNQGLLDEILLRLFIVTAVVWLAQRWRGTHVRGAVSLAILVAALLQTLLYFPSLLAIGFPDNGIALGYTTLALVIPGLVYGVLYWWRGLTSAVLAHAATVAVAALMAV